jgi:Glycosyl hydrolase family 76
MASLRSAPRWAVATIVALGLCVSMAHSASPPAPCPTFCGSAGGPELLSFDQLSGDRLRLALLLAKNGPVEIVVTKATGGRLVRTAQTVINLQPREVLLGRIPVRGRLKTITKVRLRKFTHGQRERVVSLRPAAKPLPAGLYILTVNAITSKGKIRVKGSSIVVRVEKNGRLGTLLAPYPAPSAVTGAPASVEATTASVNGTVFGNGKPTHYFIQYGPTPHYSQHTKSKLASSKLKTLKIKVKLSKLYSGVVYHYRIVATSCHGCQSGTTYGADQTFPTIPRTTQELDAERAVLSYNAMQNYFYASNVYPGDTSSLYTESYPASASANRYSFLWAFSRAMAGTVALAGVPSSLLGGTNYFADAADRLVGLSRYWTGAGYDSYPPAPYGSGGDKYYDDAGWIGLTSMQDYQVTGSPTALQDAKNVFNWVWPGGWAGSWPYEPGGIFWVNQGVGAGVSNHDRTTNSTAPNAELALLLNYFDPSNAATYQSAATDMYGWVNHYLYNVPNSSAHPNPTDPDGPNPNYNPGEVALMVDKVRGANTIDPALWSYNQGTMIALNVREYELTGQADYLTEAQNIATTALSTFNETNYVDTQQAPYNAIFFSGLLELYSVTSDSALQSSIISTIQTYANDAWSSYRNAHDLFRFPSSQDSGYQLLDQGAMVEIYAMLAWNPTNYGKLPQVRR